MNDIEEIYIIYEAAENISIMPRASTPPSPSRHRHRRRQFDIEQMALRLRVAAQKEREIRLGMLDVALRRYQDATEIEKTSLRYLPILFTEITPRYDIIIHCRASVATLPAIVTISFIRHYIIDYEIEINTICLPQRDIDIE